MKIIGNVGDFFGKENRGADIELEGETGWGPCYESLGGTIRIKGVAGHELGMYSVSGKLYVDGVMRSRGDYYTPAYRHEIYVNGKFIPKDGYSQDVKKWD